ncbi:hypothetical protein GCM10017673_21200 [Streptosporangium violaceochromogenes]|nr:hypothetical protein GCM10017673_21200 [Streptosporangium violaceochromogenes]
MRVPSLLGQVTLPGKATSASRARHYVRDLLAVTGHTWADDALLLVSELVTNSVRHSRSNRPGGQVTVSVAVREGTLHVDVADAGSADRGPRLRPEMSADSVGGRGLWLVQRLASAWGWREVPAGRVVWFRLAKG